MTEPGRVGICFGGGMAIDAEDMALLRPVLELPPTAVCLRDMAAEVCMVWIKRDEKKTGA